MRLVACENCRTQYDVTQVAAPRLRCRCGGTIENVAHAPVDAEIRRCGSCGAGLPHTAETCDYCNSTVVRDAGKLSLICPECYARNAEDSRYCTNCGVEFRPEPVIGDEEETPLACPCCDCAMTRRTIGGVGLSECPRCNGLWVPDQNFDALVNRAIQARRQAPSAGFGTFPERRARPQADPMKIVYRQCPVCRGMMQRKNFGRRSGLIVDWCGRHGTWLDPDELEGIAEFIMSGGLESSRDEGIEPAGVLTAMRGATAKQFEALVEAERQMMQARGEQERVRRRAAKIGRLRFGGSLGDFLEILLEW